MLVRRANLSAKVVQLNPGVAGWIPKLLELLFLSLLIWIYARRRGDENFLGAELEKVLLPYTLSVPTQIAGVVALDFRREMEERVASLVEERGNVFPRLLYQAETGVAANVQRLLETRAPQPWDWRHGLPRFAECQTSAAWSGAG